MSRNNLHTLIDLESIKSKVAAAQLIHVTVPSEFICPITRDVMDHPMMTKLGVHYERSAILALLKNGYGTCPVTQTPLTLRDMITDRAMTNKIDFWLWENEIRSVPVSSADFEDGEEPVLYFTNEKTVDKQGPKKPSTAKESKRLDVLRRLFTAKRTNHVSARAA